LPRGRREIVALVSAMLSSFQRIRDDGPAIAENETVAVG
jgi:hypothetical protein